jgi:hypothetical protein
MIHSLSGGIIENYDKLTYALVEINFVSTTKAWYISPFAKIKVGDEVLVPYGSGSKLVKGSVIRVDIVTKQTAPYPINRTKEIDCILSD